MAWRPPLLCVPLSPAQPCCSPRAQHAQAECQTHSRHRAFACIVPTTRNTLPPDTAKLSASPPAGLYSTGACSLRPLQAASSNTAPAPHLPWLLCQLCATQYKADALSINKLATQLYFANHLSPLDYKLAEGRAFCSGYCYTSRASSRAWH